MSSISTAILILLSIASMVHNAPVILLESPQQSFQPYAFGYEFGDGLGMAQHRSESSDGTGAVSGRYGYLDPLGTYRNVEYTADKDGYRAVVRSNEPGSVSQNSADAVFVVGQPSLAAAAQGLRRNSDFIAL